jgi:hypothetical protein
MKGKTVFGVVLIILMAFCLVGGSYAQPAVGGPEGLANLKKLDTNKDGKVSKDEFDGPPDHFATFDVNKDGFLDPTECPAPPPG